MKCCMCGKDVDKHYTPEGVMYWDKGHNPDPIVTGEGHRCCDACDVIVTKARTDKAFYKGWMQADKHRAAYLASL